MKKYVAYYRVSTERQGRSGLGINAQKQAVKDYVKDNKIIASFTETESGGDNNRIELLNAIGKAKQSGAILLVAKLDRLSRNAAFLMNLRDSGVPFECCDIPEANTLTIGIFATMAQYEREQISSRTKAALAERKKTGIKIGAANENYGKNRTPEDEERIEAERIRCVRIGKAKKFLLDKGNISFVKMALYLRGESHDNEKIAKTMNRLGFMSPNGKAITRFTVRDVLLRFEKYQNDPDLRDYCTL